MRNTVTAEWRRWWHEHCEEVQHRINELLVFGSTTVEGMTWLLDGLRHAETYGFDPRDAEQIKWKTL